jgi:thioesterase domain-containing protein
VTVARLATALDRERGASAAWSSLLAIRPHGGRPPLFLAPTLHGEVVEYRDLLGHLDPDQPVYGLRALGLDGRRHPHTTVEDMAGHYIDEIRQVQPQGPYLLAGFCFGGLVAFEMARQLHLRGQQVALLAVVDVAPGVPSAPRPRARLSHLPRRLRGVATGVRRRLWFAAHDHLLRTGRPLPRRLQDVGRVNYRAMTSYVARACPCPLTLLSAEAASAESTLVPRWRPAAAGGIELHHLAGEGLEHLDVMHEPHVGALAETLTSCIERARLRMAP